MEFNIFNDLTAYHKSKCRLYSDYVDSMFNKEFNGLADLPYLSVRAFKEFDLFSVDESDIYKTMLSSGTTGKQSKIYLDKETAKDQSKHLANSFKEYFGASRFPMLIIDSKKTSRGKTARTAAVNGFSLFGKKHFFALDGNMEFDLEGTLEFLKVNEGNKIFVFGFTFVIYQHFLKKLESLCVDIDLSNAFILHGGGWKKLESLNVSDNDFKTLIKERTNCLNVHNYYGMIEQTGSIYFECENGNLHVPTNGAVLIRNFNTLKVNGYDQEGLIQVFSSIQKSYPGHSLLTDDIGTLYPAEDCTCGRTSDILKIHGRLKLAEIRGCSDAV